jgi:hypothetical protein
VLDALHPVIAEAERLNTISNSGVMSGSNIKGAPDSCRYLYTMKLTLSAVRDIFAA